MDGLIATCKAQKGDDDLALYGQQKEGITVGKKLAAKFTLSVYWNSSYVNPSDRRDPSRV